MLFSVMHSWLNARNACSSVGSYSSASGGIAAEQQQRLACSHLPAGIASLVVPPDGKSAVVPSGIFGPASLGAASRHH